MIEILDSVLSPILQLPHWASIAVFAFIVALISSLIYMIVTDQTKIKSIRRKLKHVQNRVKEHKDNPQKALEIQKEAMNHNMELMQHTMKASLFTMLPILIIFGWMSAHLAYYPIAPNEEFTVFAEFKEGVVGNATIDITPSDTINFISSKSSEIYYDEEYKKTIAKWQLKGPSGEYLLRYSFEGNSFEQKVIISDENKYSEPTIQAKNSGNLISGNVVLEKVKPLNGFPIVGNWGWLGVYIVFSIVFNMGIRKVLKIS
jgi:uncharacterized membrane protein (DUF106 family)